MPLERIKFHRDGGPVRRGGSEPRYMTADDDSKWVVKATYFGGHKHAYFYLNEGLAALIAEALGVPVPRAAVVELSLAQARKFKSDATKADRIIFGSERIEPREALTPDTAQAAGSDALAGVMVLDALIWNSDRQAEHILAQETESGWRIWAVDHANAFAVADSLGALQPPDAPYSPEGTLKERVSKSDLEPWVERAKGITERDYVDMIKSLPKDWIVEPDAPDRLAGALVQRGEALEKVVYVNVP